MRESTPESSAITAVAFVGHQSLADEVEWPWENGFTIADFASDAVGLEPDLAMTHLLVEKDVVHNIFLEAMSFDDAYAKSYTLFIKWCDANPDILIDLCG